MPNAGSAKIAISFDLEMSTNFPTWDQTWDLRKGDLDGPTKDYALRVARRVKERGGLMHFFAVGRVFEQDDIDWLKEIVALGHPVGNHSYHHVYVLAHTIPELQHTYAKWPWRAAGRTPAEVIAHEVAMTSEAIRQRLGIEPAGFRTPGGFAAGLSGREDVQTLLLDQGFTWVSSQYAGVAELPGGPEPRTLSADQLRAVAAAQTKSQPFLYPTGLAEVPMSPLSDIHAFRAAKIELPDFLRAIETGVRTVIETGGVFDFLAHPSCLVARDPHLRAVDSIMDLVEGSRGRAALIDLGAIAADVQAKHAPRGVEPAASRQ